MPEGLFRSMHVKVLTSDKRKGETFTFYPPAGKLFTDRGMLVKASEFIEQVLKPAFPGNEFQLIPMKRNRYNVIPLPLNVVQ